ncbi:MAG: hypothetical protein RL497_129 [Pseudomonadota bacterium]|jgi:hypothetical protein
MRNVAIHALIFLLLFFSLRVTAETHDQYTNTCATELGFKLTDIPSAFHCYDGELFLPGEGREPFNDYLGYYRVNKEVDLTFACRWISGNTDAVGIEMILHNRNTGKTCFFGAKRSTQTNLVSIQIVSPTNLNPPSGIKASTYWDAPSVINNNPCVGCHVAGPYIATPEIAPFLAKNGLMNDKHDTFNRIYHAVGTTFSGWDAIVSNGISNAGAACSGCHVVGGNSTATASFMRAISTVISDVAAGNHMPPSRISDYAWVNLDIPDDSGGTSDWETLANAKAFSPTLVNCSTPQYVEGRAVGSDYIVRTERFPNKFSLFNPSVGLECKDSDQDFKKCLDYEARFYCSAGANANKWTPWQNTPLSATGDKEAPPANCKPSQMEVRVDYWDWRGWKTISERREDDLRFFNKTGLGCMIGDQTDAKCSNYSVRYVCPPTSPQIRNVWTGRALTLTLPAAAQTLSVRPLPTSSTSQTWVLQNVTQGGQNYVRIKNSQNNYYLRVTSTANEADVALSTSSAGDNALWKMEESGGNALVRFKNLYSGRYLTVYENTDNSVVKSTTLNKDWYSQLWSLE